MRRALAISLVGLCGLSACSPKEDELPDPGPGTPAFQLGMELDSPPGTEVWKCRILPPLDLRGVANINRVKHVQTASVHHMDVMVLLKSGVSLPPGEYDCADLYRDHPLLMEETNLYAAQRATDEIVLPRGVVAAVPGGITLLYELHHVNASAKPVHIESRLYAYAIPDEEVVDTIGGGVVRDRHLDIPPGPHTEWSRCVFDQGVDVLILSTHTHQLGRTATIHLWDGSTVGKQLYLNEDWQAPRILQLATPIHVSKGHGFQLACNYYNPGSTHVEWGFRATDEMCQLAVVYTPGSALASCKVQQTSDGVIKE